MRHPFALGVFAVVFSAVYLAGFLNGWITFRFYPLNNVISLDDLPRTAGPAMGWYAWIVQGFVAGLAAGLIAAAIPKRITDKLWSGWAAVGVILLVAATFYFEWHWFQGQ
ncbi:MAG: hypothetical protein FJX59_09955 [Alphaproteobacteria bacterium]|nr:hypothetical protein [Alphaproteobacteria bacterium]